MNNLEITIKLDPMNDGIKSMPKEIVSHDRHAVVIATNGDYRVLNQDEFDEMFSRFCPASQSEPLGDYIMMYNAKQVLKVNSSRFFVGSALVIAQKGMNFAPSLTDEDIEHIRNEFASRIVTLSTGNEEFSAFELEY